MTKDTSERDTERDDDKDKDQNKNKGEGEGRPQQPDRKPGDGPKPTGIIESPGKSGEEHP